MARRTFLTVAPDLEPTANKIANHLGSRGYRVAAEKWEPGFPASPTLVATRRSTKLIVEVASKLDLGLMRRWAAYASSCSRDTRVAICLPANHNLTLKDVKELQSVGIGMYEADQAIASRVEPKDLALKVTLPDLQSLRPKVRSRLGEVYDRFEKNEWKEGFIDATKVLERQAQEYLKKVIKRSPILDRNGRPKEITAKQIDRMTLGNLADTYERIALRSATDDKIASSIGKVNGDRVRLTHRGGTRGEVAIRNRVGENMWAIVTALEDILYQK